MVSPAYKACPTFVSSLQATCQLSRSCTTLLSSGGFSVWFALSMPSCLFSVRFFHSLPLFLLLTLSFSGFPIADEIILISKHQLPCTGTSQKHVTRKVERFNSTNTCQLFSNLV